MGVGFYDRAYAARLLNVNPARLSRWVAGYTYKMRIEGRKTEKKIPPILRVDLPTIDHILALSFVELMELRVIKAFLEKNISLYRIRTAAELAMQLFQTAHPFASRRVFTDGKNIFAELTKGIEIPDVLELTRDHLLQIQSGHLLRPCLEEISFSEETTLADRWWPLSKSLPVVLDPKIAFGAPIVDGTAVRTEIVSGMSKATSKKNAAEVYVLSKQQVDAAVEFEELLAA